MIFAASIPLPVLIGGAVVANAVATLGLRQAARAGDMLAVPALGFIGLALGCYMAAFALYALVLQRAPVAMAYLVITALTQLALLAWGVGVLDERLGSFGWLGVGLILAGLTLICVQAGR